jgi:predicted small metal-binding protein
MPNGGKIMARQINCECGQTIRGETDEEVVQLAEVHIRDNHPDLVGSVSREQLLDWVEEV